jgi:hypothetical protein
MEHVKPGEHNKSSHVTATGLRTRRTHHEKAARQTTELLQTYEQNGGGH